MGMKRAGAVRDPVRDGLAAALQLLADITPAAVGDDELALIYSKLHWY